MGKSLHRSKKRRRSSSRDRLAALEAKVARLVESLSRSEVSGSRSLSSSLRSVSTEARQTDKWSGIESQSENIYLEEVSNQENCIPRDNSLAVPARQERPGDPLTECKSALKNNSIIKRDEFNAKDQDQVGIALCAFGEAISDFLKPELQLSLSSETRSAIVKVHEGAKILADLFYRLSLSRRAQIKPAFNLLAKTTVDVFPADSLFVWYLFWGRD
ncbi:hypothetical protein ALC62_14808 [Cyphomyrmex costatus]|uniref:Uncharacterized protein n=1 Tax=Cyphomyrmex costatus TaxID=456900 RepID=A0A151I8D9_9HYME|nr:hypothetical protein ALC62_14808 [Cyphomyrmex costatus]